MNIVWCHWDTIYGELPNNMQKVGELPPIGAIVVILNITQINYIITLNQTQIKKNTYSTPAQTTNTNHKKFMGDI